MVASGNSSSSCSARVGQSRRRPEPALPVASAEGVRLVSREAVIGAPGKLGGASRAPHQLGCSRLSRLKVPLAFRAEPYRKVDIRLTRPVRAGVRLRLA